MALHAYPGKVVVHNMERGEAATNFGFVLGNDEGKTHGLRSRWAQVYAKGDDITEFEVGHWVLVSHGRWTKGIDLHDEHLYMIDWPSGVTMVSDSIEMPSFKSMSAHKSAKEFEYRPEMFTDYTGNQLGL